MLASANYIQVQFKDARSIEWAGLQKMSGKKTLEEFGGGGGS
jgi:hypothetical protein